MERAGLAVPAKIEGQAVPQVLAARQAPAELQVLAAQQARAVHRLTRARPDAIARCKTPIPTSRPNPRRSRSIRV